MTKRNTLYVSTAVAATTPATASVCLTGCHSLSFLNQVKYKLFVCFIKMPLRQHGVSHQHVLENNKDREKIDLFWIFFSPVRHLPLLLALMDLSVVLLVS